MWQEEGLTHTTSGSVASAVNNCQQLSPKGIHISAISLIAGSPLHVQVNSQAFNTDTITSLYATYQTGFNLVFPVVPLCVLYDSVAELEEIAGGLVTLVHQVPHLEQGLPAVLHGDHQQVENLGKEGG